MGAEVKELCSITVREDMVDDLRTGTHAGGWSESELEELESLMAGSEPESDGVSSESREKGSEEEGSNSLLSSSSETGIRGGRSK